MGVIELGIGWHHAQVEVASVERVEREADHPLQGPALLVELVARQLHAVAVAHIGRRWREENRGLHASMVPGLGGWLSPRDIRLHDREIHRASFRPVFESLFGVEVDSGVAPVSPEPAIPIQIAALLATSLL